MWKLFISLRYLFAKTKQKFISIISLLSILGVALGVAALIIVISIMTGFDEEIQQKIIGTYAHIIVTAPDGINNPKYLLDLLREDGDVISAAPFIERQTLMRKGEKILGVIVRGLDPELEPDTTNIGFFTGSGNLNLKSDNIIIGSELKKNLGLSIGDKVSLISPDTRAAVDFKISDTFTSGRYDYDANVVCINLETAKSLFKTKYVTGIGVKIADSYNVRKVRENLKSKIQFPYTMRTWMDLDRNLMKALAMEKKIMFFILGLIIMVACFNISSSLIMMVMEKTKDIGILKAIGAGSFDIGLIFLLEGLFIGLIGTGLGTGLGIYISKNINALADMLESLMGIEFFPSDIYYLSSIPSKILLSDVSTIVGFAVILTIISAIYPALQASRLDPVDAIRIG